MKTNLRLIAATSLIAGMIVSTTAALAATQAPASDAASTETAMKHRHHKHATPGQIFGRMDLNKDGVITQDEVVARADKRFEKVDTNKDGFIEKSEAETYFGTRHAKGVERMFGKLDTDRDGKLSKAEFEASALKRFARLDETHDGKVTLAEFEAVHAAKMHRHHHKGRPADINKTPDDTAPVTPKAQ